MDINDLFDGIMKSINQFTDEIAEQRLQDKLQESGRGPENEGKNAENFEAEEKRGMADWCPADAVASLRDAPEGSRSVCSQDSQAVVPKME
ncbi:MAG: hypothetical protein WC913_04985 [Desulfuromonas sp.]